jgi:hypothetical protein
VICDTAGAAYVCGFQTTSPFGTALLLQKFSPSGQLLWSRSHPGYPGDLLPQALLLTSRQHIVLAALATHPSSALLLFWYDAEGVLLHELHYLDAGGSAIGTIEMTADWSGAISLALNFTDGNLALLRYTHSGELAWQKRITSAEEEWITAIAVDSVGSLFVAGRIQSTETVIIQKFDASGGALWRSFYYEPGRHTPLAIAAGREGGCYLLANSNLPDSYENDLLTLSFTAEGSLAWSARHATGLEKYYNARLALDQSEHLYVAGLQNAGGELATAVLLCYDVSGAKLWERTCEKSGSAIELQELALSRSGELFLSFAADRFSGLNQCLTVKYNPAGTLQWASSWPGDDQESPDARPAAMAVTRDGRCIIAGEQRSAIGGSARLLVMGLDSAGKNAWQVNSGGEITSHDVFIDFQADASGRSCVLGRSREGDVDRTFLTARGLDGTLLWQRPLTSQIGSNTSLAFLSIDRGGAAYTGGIAQDQQGRDVFTIARIGAAGELLWWKTTAAADQYSCTIAAQALDQQGNLIVTGPFYRTPTAADPGADVCTFKLDPDGRLIWQALYSGGAGSDDHPLALAVDASGHACVATVGKKREILRYDPDGKLLWRAGYSRSVTSYDRPEQLAIDPEQNIWLWSYTSDWQAGIRQQGVLSKFSPEGRRLWQILEGEPLGFVRSIFLSTDSRGQATAAGYYWEGPETQHYFVTRIDEEGKVLWRTITGNRMILDGLVDRQGCTWLLTDAGAGRREVVGYDDRGESVGTWPVAEVNASRMLLDINGRFYFAANQVGYGWSAFYLSCYTAGTAAAMTIPRMALLQNYPNPFNISTTIRYAVPTAGRVRITIYDRLGREVAQPVDAPHTAGWHELVWNSALASGLYFIRLQSDEGMLQEKMLLLR